MSLLTRIRTWMYPALPDANPPLVPARTLDARSSLAMERYAAIAQVLSPNAIGRPTWPDRDPNVYDSQAYRLISLFFRCVNLIAYAAGTAPLRVYDEAKDDDTVPDHPLRLLMRQPNPHMGESLFWANVTVRTAIAGFCVVEKERNGLGGVVALNPLRSAWLKAVPRGKGVTDWQYKIPGIAEPYPLAAEDVVVFRWADTPDGSPYGIGPIATCIHDAGLLAKMTDFLGNLFDRGGVPLYGLIPAPDVGTLGQAEADAMKEAFVARRGGLRRAGEPMILEGISDVKKLQFDLDELAYTDLRDVSELAICQAFGIPPRKAITRVGLEHTTQNATAGVEDGEFYRDAIVPLWTRYDDAATTSLLPDFETMPTTRYLGFDTSDVAALQDDRDTKASWVIQGFAGGLFSQHTVFRELGIPLPKTDDFYQRSIAVEAIPADDPLGLKAAAETPATTTTPAPTPTTTTTPAPQLASVRIVEMPGMPSGKAIMWAGPSRQQPGESLADYVKRAAVSIDIGPESRLTRRKAIGAANRKAIGKIADTRTPSLDAFLAKQSERIAATVKAPVGVRMAAVGQNGHGRETFSVRDIDWQTEEVLLLTELDKLYHLSGETAFTAASDHLGIAVDWNLGNPRIRAVLDKLGHRVVGITEETRINVGEIVTKGLDAGKTLREIADELSSAHAFSPARAATIARTESMVAYGEASILGYKETGVVDRIEILDNPDHVDDYGATDGLTCATRNGTVWPLDEAMDHIYADHPNGSACAVPILAGED